MTTGKLWEVYFTELDVLQPKLVEGARRKSGCIKFYRFFWEYTVKIRRIF